MFVKEANQFNRIVVNFEEFVFDWNRFHFELHSVKTQLSRDVRASQLHVHRHQLHRAHTPLLHRLNEVRKLLKEYTNTQK